MARAVLQNLTFLLVFSSSAATGQPYELTDKQRTDIASVIRSEGYNCPTVVSAGGRGEDAYGKVLRVRCGPTSGRGTMDQFQQFRLSIRPNGSAIVRPWE